MKAKFSAVVLMVFATGLVQEATAQRHRHGDRGRYDDRYDNRYHDDRDYHRDYDRRPPVVAYCPPPLAPVRVGRPPSPYHVWIAPEYVWRSGRYVAVPGYWARPPRRGMQYNAGFWQPARGGGFLWVSGRWISAGVRW